MLFVGPQPSMGHRYALMQRTDPHRRDAVQLRFQPAKLASAARTTRSLPLPVLTSFRRGGLPTRPLISPPLLAVFDNKELDPPTHRACGSSSVNESLKCLLNFSKASAGCYYPDSVVVSAVCPCPPLGVCPSVDDCRCRPFAQMCNLRSGPQSIPPTESFST